MDWLTLRAGRVRIPIGAPYGKPSGLDQRLGVLSHDQLLQKRTGSRGHLHGGLACGLSFVRQTAPHSLPFFVGLSKPDSDLMRQAQQAAMFLGHVPNLPKPACPR